MNIQRNYQKEMDKLLQKLVQDSITPRLLLHSCCAPCSSYVLEYLSQYFHITIFYYNPNITYIEEYQKRVKEQQRLISLLPVKNPVQFRQGTYEPKRFFEMAKGLESCPEGGKRCFLCYEMRLLETAKLAKEEGFDYFATTLSVSPYKNAAKLNEIGERLSQKYDIPFLAADFKKKNGYKRSIELSKEYELYRQNYCGCVYSRMNRPNSSEEPDKE